ncbi:hypothetical protein ABH989_001623 [Bradyrhizobium ottawaense]
MAGLDRERIGEQLALLDLVREQDVPRRRLVVVELGEEGAEHLFGGVRLLRARKIGPVAPVLAGAEEEHLDAGEAALLMDGEHVGFLDGARIDALLRLDRRQSGEAVAVECGALELELTGRLLHLARKLLLHRMALAGQEVARLAHQGRIAGKVDLAGAGAGAAADLVEQAGPAAALEEGIRAGADQEGALQRRDGAVDRAGGGERTEIAPGPALRAAMFQDLRRPMVTGDQDVGKRFVVAQLHVEARPQLLDEVGFQQQRLGLGVGRDDLHGDRGRDHAQDAGRLWRILARIVGEALFDVLGLADIEHVGIRIEHAIDAGRGRGEPDRALDRLMAGRQRAFADGAALFQDIGQPRIVLVIAAAGGGIEIRRRLGWDVRRGAKHGFGRAVVRIVGGIVNHGANLGAGGADLKFRPCGTHRMAAQFPVTLA